MLFAVFEEFPKRLVKYPVMDTLLQIPICKRVQGTSRPLLVSKESPTSRTSMKHNRKGTVVRDLIVPRRCSSGRRSNPLDNQSRDRFINTASPLLSPLLKPRDSWNKTKEGCLINNKEEDLALLGLPNDITVILRNIPSKYNNLAADRAI